MYLLTSTLWGQHSTARLSIIRASSGSSNSTASFHKRTDFGICSKAGKYYNVKYTEI